MPRDTTHIRVPIELSQALGRMARERGSTQIDVLRDLMAHGLANPETSEHLEWVLATEKVEAALAVLQDYEEDIVEALAEATGSRAASRTTKLYDATVQGLEEILEAMQWEGGDDEEDELDQDEEENVEPEEED